MAFLSSSFIFFSWSIESAFLFSLIVSFFSKIFYLKSLCTFSLFIVDKLLSLFKKIQLVIENWKVKIYMSIFIFFMFYKNLSNIISKNKLNKFPIFSYTSTWLYNTLFTNYVNFIWQFFETTQIAVLIDYPIT